jgi:hypothetical protein
MNKSLIITIAITALVTWTVTRAADWLFNIARARVIGDTSKNVLRCIFNKNNLTLFFDLCWIALTSSALVFAWFDKTPIKRSDVILLCFSTVGFMFFCCLLTAHVFLRRHEFRDLFATRKKEGISRDPV